MADKKLSSAIVSIEIAKGNKAISVLTKVGQKMDAIKKTKIPDPLENIGKGGKKPLRMLERVNAEVDELKKKAEKEIVINFAEKVRKDPRLATTLQAMEQSGASKKELTTFMTKSVEPPKETLMSKATKFAVPAAGIATVAAIGAELGYATKKSIEFQAGLKKVGTLGDSKAQLDEYRDTLMKLGPEFGESVTSMTKPLYDARSAGLGAAEAQMFLAKALPASKTGIGELSDAVDFGTSALNAYHMDVSQTEKVFDSVQATIKGGKTDIKQIGAAVSQFASQSAALGSNLDADLAALAAMTSQGAKTSESATRLKAIYTALASQQDKAASMGEDVAESFSLQNLKAKGLQGAMQDVYEAVDGDVTKLQELLGSSEAVSGVLMITGENAAMAQEKLDEIANSSGMVTKEWKRMAEENPEIAIARAREKLHAFAMTLTTAVLPAVVKGAEGFAKFIDYVQDNKWLPAVAATTAAVIALQLAMAKTGVTSTAQLIPALIKGAAGLKTFAAKAWAAIGPIGLIAAATVGLAMKLADLHDETVRMNEEFGKMTQNANEHWTAYKKKANALEQATSEFRKYGEVSAETQQWLNDVGLEGTKITKDNLAMNEAAAKRYRTRFQEEADAYRAAKKKEKEANKELSEEEKQRRADQQEASDKALRQMNSEIAAVQKLTDTWKKTKLDTETDAKKRRIEEIRETDEALLNSLEAEKLATATSTAEMEAIRSKFADRRVKIEQQAAVELEKVDRDARLKRLDTEQKEEQAQAQEKIQDQTRLAIALTNIKDTYAAKRENLIAESDRKIAQILKDEAPEQAVSQALLRIREANDLVTQSAQQARQALIDEFLNASVDDSGMMDKYIAMLEKVQAGTMSQKQVDGWVQAQNAAARYQQTLREIQGELASGLDGAMESFLSSVYRFDGSWKSAWESFKGNAIDALASAAARWILGSIGNLIIPGSGGLFSALLPFAQGGRPHGVRLGPPASVVAAARGTRVEKPTLAVVGEGRDGETIIPDPKLASIVRTAIGQYVREYGGAGGGDTIVVNTPFPSATDAIRKTFETDIARAQRRTKAFRKG